MSRLRFAMVSTFYPPHNFGGDGIGIQRLTHALARRGHEVTVIYDADAYVALSGGKDPRPQAEPNGVQTVPLHSKYGMASLLLTQQTGHPVVNGRRISKLLDEADFDVIHYNNVSLVGGPGVLASGRGLKVYEAHEHWLVCPTHVLWRHGREVCTGRECVRCTLRNRRPPQLWRYTGLLERQLHHVDAFIAKSEFSREKHREFGFPRPMEVIPYFLPDEGAAPVARHDESPHPRPYFLFVGRLEKIKGLDDVIPVFRDRDGADLLIAGDGEYAGTLRALAGDSPRVKFLGRITPEQLSRYYRHARALVVPSVCYETFGIILIEAFRQGTPVIARRIGPFPEIVDRAGGGMLFSDATGLARALERLEQEAGLRETLGRAGRNAFVRYWSEEAVVPQYLGLIRRIALQQGRTAIADTIGRENVA